MRPVLRIPERRQERGFILATVLVFLVVLTLTAFFAARLTSTNTQVVNNLQNEKQAFFVAEAGIDEALYRLSLKSPGCVSMGIAPGAGNISCNSNATPLCCNVGTTFDASVAPRVTGAIDRANLGIPQSDPDATTQIVLSTAVPTSAGGSPGINLIAPSLQPVASRLPYSTASADSAPVDFTATTNLTIKWDKCAGPDASVGCDNTTNPASATYNPYYPIRGLPKSNPRPVVKITSTGTVQRSNGDIVASKKITVWAADSCTINQLPGNGSILTLGNACNQGINLSGGGGQGTITTSGDIQVNAGASTPPGTACNSAVSLGGALSSITSTNGTVTSVGGVAPGPSGSMTGYTPDPTTGVGAVTDPYWDPSNPSNPNNVLPPCFTGANATGTCQGNTINTVKGGNTGNGNQNTMQAGNGAILQPGIYYGGIKITGTGVTMQPGIYIMAGGGFSVGTGSTGVTGTGVVIYNTSDPGSTSPTAGSFDNTGGNSSMGLSAYAPNNPNDPWYGLKGFVFFQDRNLSPQPPLFLQGGTTSGRELDGIIYAPGASITFQGNQPINLAGSLIVQQMSWNGSSDLNIANGGTPPPNNACSAATYQRLAWLDS